MNELHLFAGAGGGILGGVLLGHTCVCAVEIEPYCRKVLLQRQRDGILPRFPIWDDVRTFDGKPWRGKVDCICGGFPCQDISTAGKGAGIDGKKSGLWSEFARIIGEVRPAFVFVENSPMLVVRGLGRVLGDLSEMGYNAKWCTCGAAYRGKTIRDRMWILGKSDSFRMDGLQVQERATVEVELRLKTKQLFDPVSKINRRTPESFACGMDYGLAHWMERFKAVGNGQIPIVAAGAFNLLLREYAREGGK